MYFIVVNVRIAVIPRGYPVQSSFKNTDFWDLNPELESLGGAWNLHF